MDRAFIEQLITKHEGRRNRAYKDSLGILTIGIGWNLEDPDSIDICDHFELDLDALKNGEALLTNRQIDEVFDYQLTRTISDACSVLPGFMAMPDKVQAVVVDMLFQLGLPRYRKFVNMIAALRAGDWKQAAIDAAASLWAQQTPNRAADDIALLEAA